jgi:rfaE bifunctional protein nucleotidyltransferase chain/domain/rfaE bifunctional protein kinase chain/domain
VSAGPLVVVGDALLDVDVEGSADRLCPDAPVPVVDVAREWQRAGGAGLAATLAARSVPDVVLVCALGDDDTGRRVAESLPAGVDLVRLPLAGATPSKTRVRAAGHSLVRLDHGDGRVTEAALGADVIAVLRSAAAILVADYGRGVAAHPGIRRAVADAAGRVPVVWDPHPRGPQPVPGVRLATPNEREARAAAGGPVEPGELALALRDRWASDAVAVTVGDRGAVLGADEVERIPVPAALRVAAGTALDTCGAGDRFAAAATAALLDGVDLRAAVTSAVAAAARFIGAGAAGALSEPVARPGMRRDSGAVSAFELAARVRRRGGTLVATGGCFDLLHPGHVRLLERARALGDALVVCVNSDESVRGLKGPSRPIVSVADRVRLLRALDVVDAVAVFDEPTPARLLDRLAPDIWAKGSDHADTDLPEADVVRGHGGRIVFIPMLAGYSTTRLVGLARAGEQTSREATR